MLFERATNRRDSDGSSVEAQLAWAVSRWEGAYSLFPHLPWTEGLGEGEISTRRILPHEHHAIENPHRYVHAHTI